MTAAVTAAAQRKQKQQLQPQRQQLPGPEPASWWLPHMAEDGGGGGGGIASTSPALAPAAHKAGGAPRPGVSQPLSPPNPFRVAAASDLPNPFHGAAHGSCRRASAPPAHGMTAYQRTHGSTYQPTALHHGPLGSRAPLGSATPSMQMSAMTAIGSVAFANPGLPTPQQSVAAPNGGNGLPTKLQVRFVL